MSAPIPSFFKIRCVLVILSFLLFFLLIGMARHALSACTDTGEDGSCIRIVAVITELGTANCVEPTGCTRRTGTLNDDCTVTVSAHKYFGNAPYGSMIFKKYLCTSNGCTPAGQVGGVITPVTGGGTGEYDPAPDIPRSVPSNCDDCPRAREIYSQQCGEAGVWTIDPDTCAMRCGDCAQEAFYECPAPYIVVWNNDGDCSYNCSFDTDGDGLPDIEDPNDDNDALDDPVDPCPTNPSLLCKKPLGPDTDGDGTADVSDRDADMDGDGFKNWEDDDDDGDNVKDVSDLDADPDGDGLLNLEDDDDDGDGRPDEEDPDADPDADEKVNEEDEDDDNDTILDIEDPDKSKYLINTPAYSWTSEIGQRFSARFHSFVQDMRGSSIFSIPSQIFGSGSIPSGGSPVLNYEGGEYFGGSQTIELSSWSVGLAVIRAALYALFAAVAVKIALLGR